MRQVKLAERFGTLLLDDVRDLAQHSSQRHSRPRQDVSDTIRRVASPTNEHSGWRLQAMRRSS